MKTIITEREYRIYLLGVGDGFKRLKSKKKSDIAEYFDSLGQKGILRTTNPGAAVYPHRFTPKGRSRLPKEAAEI